jgi:hypothetical protein
MADQICKMNIWGYLQGWKKPGFKKKPAQWVFLFFFGFFGFFGPEERVLGFFQFQEYF